MRACAAVDLRARRRAEIRHRRIGREVRFLLGYGERRAQVRVGRIEPQRREGRRHVAGPAIAVAHRRGQQLEQLRARLLRRARRRRAWCGRATGEGERECHDDSDAAVMPRWLGKQRIHGSLR